MIQLFDHAFDDEPRRNDACSRGGLGFTDTLVDQWTDERQSRQVVFCIASVANGMCGRHERDERDLKAAKLVEDKTILRKLSVADRVPKRPVDDGGRSPLLRGHVRNGKALQFCEARLRQLGRGLRCAEAVGSPERVAETQLSVDGILFRAREVLGACRELWSRLVPTRLRIPRTSRRTKARQRERLRLRTQSNARTTTNELCFT